AQRRADRPGQARGAEPGARQRDHGPRAKSLRGRGPALQPRLAETDPGDPVRAPEAAGEEENAFRPALDRRGFARRAGARASAAAAHPRAPHAVQAEVDLYRQTA